MKDSGGIAAGDRVRVAGVSVGRVKDVRLTEDDEWPVALAISLRREVAVRDDASARISTVGLLGASFLQIDPGTPDRPRLEPDGALYGDVGMGMESALAQVDEVAERVVEVLDKTGTLLDQVSTDLVPMMSRLDRFLAEENAADLSETLAAMRGITTEVSPRIGPLLARMEGLAAEAESTLQSTPELVEELTGLVRRLEGSLGPDGERLDRLLASAQGTIDSTGEAMSMVTGKRSELDVALADLQETLANLKAFSQQVKERPSSLVRIRNPRPRTPGDGVPGSSR